MPILHNAVPEADMKKLWLSILDSHIILGIELGRQTDTLSYNCRGHVKSCKL